MLEIVSIICLRSSYSLITRKSTNDIIPYHYVRHGDPFINLLRSSPHFIENGNNISRRSSKNPHIFLLCGFHIKSNLLPILFASVIWGICATIVSEVPMSSFCLKCRNWVMEDPQPQGRTQRWWKAPSPQRAWVGLMLNCWHYVTIF
jgi:hypothetical protein